MVGRRHRVIVQDDNLDSGFFERANPLAVFCVLCSSDQKDIGMKAEDLLSIENVIVVPADTRKIFHLRKRFRENLIFPIPCVFPTVFCQGNDFIEAGSGAHHHEIDNVVSDDKSIRLIFKTDFSALNICNFKGCSQHRTTKGR